VDEYNLAPIVADEMPHELKALVQSASIVFASSLARSRRTAELLARGQPVASDSIYDEAPLPSPWAAGPYLPIRLWFAVMRVLWMLGWASGPEPCRQARLRARRAAENLIRASGPDRLVVLVGHGVFMTLIASELERNGWRRLDPLPSGHLSSCCFMSSERDTASG
jgi:broad specificity phosphatase PhoE